MLEEGGSEGEGRVEANVIQKGDRVLIIDDVVATGGTALAVAQLIERSGGIVAGVGCLIDIPVLGAKSKLPYPLFSLLSIGDYE